MLKRQIISILSHGWAMYNIQLQKYQDEDDEAVKEIFTMGLRQRVLLSFKYLLKYPNSVHVHVLHSHDQFQVLPVTSPGCFSPLGSLAVCHLHIQQIHQQLPQLDLPERDGLVFLGGLKWRSGGLSQCRVGIAQALAILNTTVVQIDAQRLNDYMGYKEKESSLLKVLKSWTVLCLIEDCLTFQGDSTVHSATFCVSVPSVHCSLDSQTLRTGQLTAFKWETVYSTVFLVKG